MENLVFSFQVVMPVFLVIALGYFLKVIGLLKEQFVADAVRFNFKVGLPVLLFYNIYTSEFQNAINPSLFLFTFLGIAGSALILWLIVPRFERNRRTASALIHTMFRSNFLLLGIPLATNMFGEDHISAVSLLIPIAIPTFNFFAVVILASFEENDSRGPAKKLINTARGILKNPLILASAAAILCQLIPIRLPGVLEKAIGSVSSLATPLALITLGAQLDAKTAAGNLKYSVPAAFGKLIVVPGIVMTLAILLGFRGYELGGIYILFSAPSAVSCYVMAKEMNSDSQLTGDVVLLTTLFSMFTIFGGIYLLKTFSLL